MKIVIDGRLYGLENAGLGRYVINLVNELQKIDGKNKYVLLLRKKYFDQLNLKPNWIKVLADFRHYTLIEQLRLPAILKSQKPDLVHFPHFNVPLFYNGPYVVTIHDILMHKQRGFNATTLPVSKYLIKRSGYKLVFRHAVKAAKKIIVPSQAVKDEVAYYYNLDPDKIVVTYEGK